MPQRESGMALIATLVILLVVTMLGLTAMRAGLLNLSIATNSQVDNLLFRGSDTALLMVENQVNADPVAAASAVGLVGSATLAPGIEQNNCLTKTGFVAGNCTLTNASNFMSARDAVAVKLTMLNPTRADGEPAKVLTPGSDDTYADDLVIAISTSVLPAFNSAASSSDIQACLNKPSDDSKDVTVETTTDCLSKAGAAFTTTVQEYAFSGAK